MTNISRSGIIQSTTIPKKVIKKMNRFLRLASFSGDSKYDIDMLKRRCTCTAFQKEGSCKHLLQVGAYPLDKTWSSGPRPTFSQALSGLVKTIRLRMPQEAIQWMLYLDAMNQEGGRFRVARRILIGSAEDGHSIAVMERVARNFTHLCRPDTHLMEFAAEIVRICKVPNWWVPETGGHDYIYSGMTSNRIAYLYGQGGDTHDEALEILEKAINDKNRIGAMAALERIMLYKKCSKTAMVEYVRTLGQAYDNHYAVRLCDIHLMHKTPLANDANFLCQAVWLLAGGECSVLDEIHPVMATEVRELMKEAWDEMVKYKPMNSAWADGIHCAGVDRRFAGMWNDMNAVCQAYLHYGRVDPNDKWLQRFYLLDYLKVEPLGDEQLPEDF